MQKPSIYSVSKPHYLKENISLLSSTQVREAHQCPSMLPSKPPEDHHLQLPTASKATPYNTT
jgi:hypothetical protein